MKSEWLRIGLGWAWVEKGRQRGTHPTGHASFIFAVAAESTNPSERRLEWLSYPSGGGVGGCRGHFSGNTKKESMGLPLSFLSV